MHTCSSPTAHTPTAAAGAARERNRGAETITTLCGERPDSKGKAYGGGRRGARTEGAAIQISVAGKGLTGYQACIALSERIIRLSKCIITIK